MKPLPTSYQAGYLAGANLNLDPGASQRNLNEKVAQQIPLF
jgi:hypothetical protein